MRGQGALYFAGFLTVSAVLILFVGRLLIACFSDIDAMDGDR